jgi:hydrogenase expression/formation protein HypD
MKYLTEFRNGEIAQRMAREIAAITTRPWKIMEVCGGQTHSIIRNGIDQMLPAGIEMIHGPGCPVCVTPLELIDKALAIAAQPGVIFCSFGDMLRVPRAICFKSRARAAMCGWSIRRWTPWNWLPRTPASRWSFSVWVLRPRLRPMP